MKKIVINLGAFFAILGFMFISTPASAIGPDQIRIFQYNPAGTIQTFRDMVVPTTTFGLIASDPNNIQVPHMLSLTSDLSVDGSYNLSVNGLANKLENITSLISAGSGTSLSGAGTVASPYVISATGSATTWGSITGTLSSQTDLQTALNSKEASITSGTTSQYWRGDKSFQTLDKTAVGLANVDNTSDANKPVSTATQTALNAKESTLTFSSPLSRSTNTISIPVATSSANGYLSSTDWSTFNGKGSGTLTSITSGTGLSGGTITTSGTISMPNTGTVGTYSGVTTDAQGRVTAGTNRSWNNTPGRSIVTGTGATGFQPSATKDTEVKYGIKVTSTASIASGQEGYVTLEIAPTNSATPSDWVSLGAVCGNGQTYSLAIALQGVQPTYCQVSATVPAGYYAKLRSVNVTGTPTYTYIGGQEMSF